MDTPYDTWYHILTPACEVPNPISYTDYHRWRRVCKMFYEILDEFSDKYFNHLLAIMYEWPKRGWKFRTLGANPNITWESIINNPRPHSGEWNAHYVSRNPNITWDIVQANPDLPFTDLGTWCFGGLSYNPNITYEIIYNNINESWHWDALSRHPNITLDIILNEPGDWDYDVMAANPNITWQMVIDNPYIPWNYNYMSSNPNITLDIVNDNPNIKWNWDKLLINPNIGVGIIPHCSDWPTYMPTTLFIDRLNGRLMANVQFYPDTRILYKNPSTKHNIEDVHKNSIKYLSMNPNITSDDVLNNKSKPWHLGNMSENPFNR